MDKKQLKTFVNQAQHGNAEAFGKLYSEYATDLYRFALWYLHSQEDAEDAVQDACLCAFKKIRYLKKENSFKSWFFKILANVCKDKLSADKNSNIIPIDSSDSLPEISDPHSLDFVLSTELSDLISTLSPTDKSIVLLACIGRFSSKEIGSALHLKSSTVRSRLARSLAKLRVQLT